MQLYNILTFKNQRCQQILDLRLVLFRSNFKAQQFLYCSMSKIPSKNHKSIYYLFQNMHIQTSKTPTQRHYMNYSRLTALIMVGYLLFLCFGHLILTSINQNIRFWMIMYLVVRTLNYVLGGMICYWQTNKVCERANDMQVREFNQDFRTTAYTRNIFHIFVVKNGMKDIEVLRLMMNRLKLHQGTKANYLVYLSIGYSELREYAEMTQLIQFYMNQFFVLQTIQQQTSEQSNPFWFVTKIEQKYIEMHNIDVNKTLVTMIDADSWVPEVYIRQIEDRLAESQAASTQKHYIYQSIQIYTRNHLQVPFTTRIYNQLNVCLQANDCFARYQPSLPQTNYSLHYLLAKKICQQTKTTNILLSQIQSQIEIKLIYAPFNRLHHLIEGGQLTNTKATFHCIVNAASKQLNLLYSIVHLFANAPKLKHLSSIVYILVQIGDKFLVLLVLQTIYSQTFTLLLSKAFTPLNIENVSILVSITLIVLTSVHFLCYEFAKRKASFVLFGLTNKTIVDIFQFNVLVAYIVVFFIIPGYVVCLAKSILVEERQMVTVHDVKIDKPK